jgi:alpha-L-rhamnosidase
MLTIFEIDDLYNIKSGPFALIRLLSWIRNLCAAFFYFVFFLTMSGCSCNNSGSMKFASLLVEYSENPVNIDMAHPRFSWIISSGGRRQKQIAYRITVASSSEKLDGNSPDMWDSGKVESDETIQHEYEPGNLISGNRYFWKVTVWDGNGNVHESLSSRFETSFLPGYAWSGKWIGALPVAEMAPPRGFYMDRTEQTGTGDTIIHDGSSLLLRSEADIVKKVESATAYVTGLGYHEFFINGQRIGDHFLAPAKTPYHKYILYDTYDVTSQIKDGCNAFGIHLGNGWYNPYKKWWNMYRMQWFGSKRAIAEIHLRYTDGSEGIICTDDKWLWSAGPLTYNCVYDGEICDGNLEQEGWTKPGFDDSGWKKVTVMDSYKPHLISHRMPAIKVKQIFNPVELKKGSGVYDMGQNFAGWVRIEARGKRNTVLKIRFAEDIRPDSTIDITSNEYANASAEYIMRGDGSEIYEPRFTFFGFRYVEISSEKGPVKILNIEGRALYSDNSIAGKFECSNQLVNKIHNATVWSQKSNMLGYPMDCPQRDERLGWLGDAQVTAEEAMLNFNMALFYENWLEGIRENQDEKSGDIPVISPRPYIKDEGIEWSSTYILMLWQFYNFYGDNRILSHHYSAMKRYMTFLDSLSTDRILPKGWIGDWGSMVKDWKEGDPASVPTAFYYRNAVIMSEVAKVLDLHDDQVYFNQLSVLIRNKYNSMFLDSLSGNYNDGSQMANAFPLYLGIVPEKLREKVLINLVEDVVEKNQNHLTTGVLGTKYMPEALAMAGRSDVAWNIINQKSPPSWNEMMQKYNTMCEFWTLKQSKNHVMMGSIDAWFYKYIAGIQTDDSALAFSSFRIKPFIPDSLAFAYASIETIRGTITSGWMKDHNSFIIMVEVPFNTSAEIYVPGDSAARITESDKPASESEGVNYQGYSEKFHLFKVGSGKYRFTINSKL